MVGNPCCNWSGCTKSTVYQQVKPSRPHMLIYKQRFNSNTQILNSFITFKISSARMRPNIHGNDASRLILRVRPTSVWTSVLQIALVTVPRLPIGSFEVPSHNDPSDRYWQISVPQNRPFVHHDVICQVCAESRLFIKSINSWKKRLHFYFWFMLKSILRLD